MRRHSSLREKVSSFHLRRNLCKVLEHTEKSPEEMLKCYGTDNTGTQSFPLPSGGEKAEGKEEALYQARCG